MDNFLLHESLWNDKCDYIQPDTCTNLNTGNYNLIILQLNIRGLLSHQSELKLLLQKLNNRNSSADIILLCETFLNNQTERLVQIPGYTLITNNCQANKGGGTAILVKQGVIYNRRKDLNIFIEKEVESTFIELLSKSKKYITIGSMYRPPNTKDDTFTDSILKIKHKISLEKERRELIIGMDHNYDLLKSTEHKKTQYFLDTILNHELFPKITRPTRITKQSATLIDNVFISLNLHKNFESSILIDDMSDHLPTLTLLRQTKLKDTSPLIFKSRNLTNTKIKQINQSLYKIDWIGKLTGENCNDNYNIFTQTLNEVIDKISPLKQIRISGKRVYKEPWMSRLLERHLELKKNYIKIHL